MERRELLAGMGVALATAGCAQSGGDGGGAPDGVPPTIHDYLSEVGNYDGELADRTGESEVTVSVGAEGNGGNLAFAPVAFRIDAGTTVTWEWTGQGGLHNVVSVGDSDFEFDSGQTVIEREPFSVTFEETGVGVYHCEPHSVSGMRGGFEVV